MRTSSTTASTRASRNVRAQANRGRDAGVALLLASLPLTLGAVLISRRCPVWVTALYLLAQHVFLFGLHRVSLRVETLFHEGEGP